MVVLLSPPPRQALDAAQDRTRRSQERQACRRLQATARDLKRKTEGGHDPVAEGHKRRDAITFQELAEKRLEKDNGISTGTRRLYGELLKGKVFKFIGNTPAPEVTKDDVVRVLNKIDADRQADLVKNAISSTFKWGMKRGEVKSNPCEGLGPRAALGVRERVLTDHELKTLWHAVDREDLWISQGMRAIIRLCLLTGQRRSEVAGARKEELTGLDDSNPTWTIPGDKRIRGKVVEGRTKNGKEQVLPLSSQAADMFREAIAASDDPEFLFPARMTSVEIGKTPRTPHIHGQSVSGTMRKLRIESGIKDATVHDLRRTMATWMGEQGVRPDVIDLVLHHLPKAQDVTRRHYNFARLCTDGSPSNAGMGGSRVGDYRAARWCEQRACDAEACVMRVRRSYGGRLVLSDGAGRLCFGCRAILGRTIGR